MSGMFKIQGLRYQGRGPFDLAIQAGECLCLSGASGSGKSLMLRALADLDPAEGDISLNGESSQSMPAPQWRKRVSLLPAESQWWFDDVGAHFPPYEEDFYQELRETLQLNPKVAEWEVSRLSTGERQRLGLLRLLLHKPQVLLLDEPTANLDRKNQQQVEKLLQTYQQQQQAMLFWVSHDLEQIKRVGQQHWHLDENGELTEVRS